MATTADNKFQIAIECAAYQRMNRYSPYRLQNNDYSEDFNYINKAAYFDYQRSKIYWRNKKNSSGNKSSKIHYGKGRPVWKPKRINEVVQLPVLKRCPHCGCENYIIKKEKNIHTNRPEIYRYKHKTMEH